MRIARMEFLPLYAIISATFLFSRIYLVQPLLVSTAWLPLAAAFVAALPALLCARLMIGQSQPLDGALDTALGRVGARIWYAALLILVLLQIKIVTAGFVSTVLTYTADLVYDRSVIIVTLIIAGLGAFIGELAVTNCARVTLWLMLIMMGVLALTSFGEARYEYFFPLLGPGPDVMLRSVLPLAGILLTPMLFLLRADTRDPAFKRTIVLCALAGAGLTALYLAIYTLALPTLPAMPTTLPFRTAMLINNGNSSIQLQLPLIALWNGCQLLMLSALMALAGELLRRIIPGVSGYKAGIVLAIELAGCTLVRMEDECSAIVSAAAYPLITAGFVAAGIIFAIKKRTGAAPAGAQKG